MMNRSSFFPLGGAIALMRAAGPGRRSLRANRHVERGSRSRCTLHNHQKHGGLQPPSGKPTVPLGSYTLAIASFNNVQITAALPASVKPGSYNLEVTANGTANFDVSIGGEGPAGPAGPIGATGATGPQGAQGPAGTTVTMPDWFEALNRDFRYQLTRL